MTGQDLINLMLQSNQRVCVTGTPENGIVAALDLEGRLFTVINDRVVSRVYPKAFIERSNRYSYLNPGGDALWPAPEGSCFGYEYNTGKWRVPPAITGASWEVVRQTASKTVIKAEIDLINNLQLGIPCEFERHIQFKKNGRSFTQNITEIIRYIGNKALDNNEFRLAPWSLAQFDSGKDCKVIILAESEKDLLDMYKSSLVHCHKSGGKYIIDTQTDFRFQLGLSKNIPWIELDQGKQLSIKRYSGPLSYKQKYIDIADVPPEQYPSDFGSKYSIYCDPSGFLELEACGGCPDILIQGTELRVNVITEYAF